MQVKLELSGTPLIKMPEHEFSQVIDNLVANAIWAIQETGRGGGEIEVGTNIQKRDKGSKNEELVFRVKDNGVGIPRDSLEDIFRAGVTASRAKGETGLGLFSPLPRAQSYLPRIFTITNRWLKRLGNVPKLLRRRPRNRRFGC